MNIGKLTAVNDSIATGKATGQPLAERTPEEHAEGDPKVIARIDGVKRLASLVLC